MYPFQNLLQVSRHGIVCTFSGQGSAWLSSFSVPPTSRKAAQVLENKDVSSRVCAELIGVTAYEIWRHTQCPKKDEYNWVCQAIINKYPVLKDTIGTLYVSIGML